MKASLYIIACVIVLTACNKPVDDSAALPDLSVRYAKGFTITREGNATRVKVTYPYKGAKSGYEYLLVPAGETPTPQAESVQVITVPIDKIVCTATTHVPHLDYLGVSDKLVGFPTTDYISSPTVRARIDSGKVTELGIDNGMNLELLYTLKPSLVMGYTMSADLGQLGKIQELGTPVVINAEYLEPDPLGRAEWIKFTALFFGKEKEADSVFRWIETEYNQSKAKLAQATSKPTVMSGIVYGDTWFLPGGQNYAAKILTDAGCGYLWANDSTQGWLELSFEKVFETGKEADLWIGVGSFTTLKELSAADKRYELFNPYKKGQVYTFNARKGAKGGNDFLELGYLRADLVLKDLGKIAHPEALPDYQLYFHKKLD